MCTLFITSKLLLLNCDRGYVSSPKWRQNTKFTNIAQEILKEFHYRSQLDWYHAVLNIQEVSFLKRKCLRPPMPPLSHQSFPLNLIFTRGRFFKDSFISKSRESTLANYKPENRKAKYKIHLHRIFGVLFFLNQPF